MKKMTLLVTTMVTLLLISACASDGPRKFNRTTQLSPGVRALLADEPNIGVNDPRIRCRRDTKSGSRLGVQTCSTFEELEQERERAQRETENATRNN